MKRGKKAQFYILAAVIIVALIISLAGISNYVITKNAPKKTTQIFDNLNNEMTSAVDYCISQGWGIDLCAKNITTIFTNYTKQNTIDNFKITIFYGNVSSGLINVIVSSTTSSGTVTASEDFGYVPSTGVEITYTTAQVFQISGSTTNYVNVTINGIIYKTPVLIDNNFIAVMLTNEGGENYVLTNQNT